MKLCIATVAMLTLAGHLWADEMDDAYEALKAAQMANNADDILKWAPEVSKLGRAEAARTKPDNMSADEWKARVEYAKQIDTVSEYALSSAALQPIDNKKVITLIDTLIAQNPKSQYLDGATPAYLAALEKTGGAAKAQEGANKLLAGQPNNEDALFALATSGKGNAEQFANRLVQVMRTKAKPEGVSEADWDRKKNTMLAYGYYTSGISAGSSARPSFPDCDRELRAGMPYISKQAGLHGTALFYLGLCNYQLSKITSDKAKLNEALQFTEQSAALAGPMQGQAQTNVAVMRRELGLGAAPVKPKAAATKGK